MAYLDDISCFSPTFEKHLDHLRGIFTRLREAKLKLHPRKCSLAVQKVKYLGHVQQPEGILPNPDKIEAVNSYPIPPKLKHVCGFLGLTGIFRPFIKDYTIIVKPLYALTKKDKAFHWDNECQQAFESL